MSVSDKTDQKEKLLRTLQDQTKAFQEGVAGLAVDEALVVADRLYTCTGRVLTSGAGTSAIVARKVAHTLNCAGTPTFFVDPTVAIHGSAGAITDGDVLLLFTKGGETDELTTLLGSIENKDVTRVAVTERPESTVGRLCDIVFPLPLVTEADPHNVIATTSILVVIAFFDAISMQLMDRRGYTLAEFARTHPGGAVGKRFTGK